MQKIVINRKLLNIFRAIIIAYLVLFFALFVRGVIMKKYIYPLKYSEIVIKYSKEYNLNSALIFATIKVESNFNENAVSNKGAIGLMQIKESTANYIANMLKEKEFDLYNANTNIKYGCHYLNYLIKRFNNIETAIVAYNAGEGRVSEWLKNKEYSENGITLTKIPYKESKEYKEKIIESFRKYTKLYKNILDK